MQQSGADKREADLSEKGASPIKAYKWKKANSSQQAAGCAPHPHHDAPSGQPAPGRTCTA